MAVYPHRYFIINKPYNIVSQFVSKEDVGLLGDIDFKFPEGIHAIGRLDSKSEGLLILTTNKRVTKLLFEGKTLHRRTYLVRVKNVVTPEGLEQLRTGVFIRIKGGVDYMTPPCEVHIIEEPKNLFSHQLELRDYVPHSWLQISLYEGKFHQVRKMVSAIRHPCKRLVRVSIEDLELGDIEPGRVKEMEEEEFFRLLKIKNWDK
ncbi:MAG: pseudouridine synthase [Taibaiella sp.]|nr:pseudouridine synthase [Taibaiella sp.]